MSKFETAGLDQELAAELAPCDHGQQREAADSASPASKPPLPPSSAARHVIGAEAPGRFTRDGDAELELGLKKTCARVRSGIRGVIPVEKLQAVLLAGGYGRGEGGVLRDPEGDRPYNDLEFYVLIKGSRHLNELQYGRRLEVLGQVLTPLAGLEVEFRITSLAELQSMPPSMFTYDLISAHHAVFATARVQNLPGCDHHRDAANLPRAEASRLLMNRATGLLLARTELDRHPFTAAAADFVRRNVAKAALACGDALLAACGEYHFSCLERHRRLVAWMEELELPGGDELVRRHREGVEFKLRPVRGDLEQAQLAVEHRSVCDLMRRCWLWVESCRLGPCYGAMADYAVDARDKWPETPWLRNFVVNLRNGGAARPWRHPRGRALAALAILLWEPALLEKPAVLRLVQKALGTNASSLPELLQAYQRLWWRVR